MDKKRLVKSMTPEEMKGFEEFIDGEPSTSKFLPRGSQKKEVAYEHFTFLSNDATRLIKQKNLLMDKIPFAEKYEQGEKLIQDQQKEIILLKKSIFEICNRPQSAYRKSMSELFDSFFEPPQT
jgi:hypothetical protein